MIMAIEATSAAQELEGNQGNITSHQLISLLMKGGVERLHQARSSLSKGNMEEADVLIEKTAGIIQGLRSSLNLDEGGEIALNLESLYDYMLNRIGAAGIEERLSAVKEVMALLCEVKDGWDQMDVA